MRHLLLALVPVAALAAGWFFFRPLPLDAVSRSAALPDGAALVARGRYLADAADCAACHTARGGKPYAGGVAFTLPFGTIRSTNSTPDPQHGIGGWSDAEFVRALRQGIGRHGENLYPAFPYASYARMSTDDAIAIHAYLKTLTPVPVDAPANSLAFPFDQRWLVRGWNLLFLPTSPWTPDPRRSAAWNRGAYLVEGPGHCAECHSPRNLLFGMNRSRHLAGGEVDGWKAWNITSDRRDGIGWWTDAELRRYLTTGHAPRHGAAAGKMREAIELSLSRLRPDDVDAIVTYLRTVPARSGDTAARVTPSTPAMQASRAWTPVDGRSDANGRRLFAGACASCHGWTGAGQQSARAALAGARAVNDASGSNLIRVILAGIEGPTPARSMPGFARSHTDAEVAAIANYVIGHFGGRTGKVRVDDVSKARK